jgi:hypothetical protein
VQQQTSSVATAVKPASGTISGMLADFSKALGEFIEEHEFKKLTLKSLSEYESRL